MCRFKCSDTGDRIQLTDEKTLLSACKVLEEGNRLTLWAYDATDTPAVSLHSNINNILTLPCLHVHVHVLYDL